MIEIPRVMRIASRRAAVIHIRIPRAEIRSVMGPGLGELRAAVEVQGIAVDGPWFTHHLRMDAQIFDFEICLPVAKPVAAIGRVEPRELPATRVARTVYQGDYEGLGAAWGEFEAWIAANGHRSGPDLYECYLTGPESNPDPAAWRTELSRPLLAR